MKIAALQESGADGRARAAALAGLKLDEAEPAGIVGFVSHGRCLVIGEEREALDFAHRVAGEIDCIVAASSDGPPEEAGIVEGIRTVRGGRPVIAGALGDFEVKLVSGAGERMLGQMVTPPVERFDLVVDLGRTPVLQQAMKPLGYYSPGADEAQREQVIEVLPEMRGEFEKPKYFNYNPEICAHGRNGKQGCTRCIDACPAEAIVSSGETVRVNPYLCQGGGVCATACPSGAMTYAFPMARDLLDALRRLLADYRAAGGGAGALLFYDGASAAGLAADLAASMPEHVLPVEVEEIGSVGMDAWLACLAYGAEAVWLLACDRTPPQVLEALQDQLLTARTILAGMGFDERCVGLVNGDQPALALQAVAARPRNPSRTPASFAAPPADKRGTLRLALQHLQAQASPGKRSVTLPAGAPFGEVRVDAAACTLCMSCVSACPTHALQDGRGLPQLNFREWNCVQCGLCERTCPEDAVRLQPRFLYDAELRERPRVLHEEQPVCCIACGKPFTTRAMLEKVSRKLEGHWMFQDDAARRRLQMCEDCRVRDMFTAEAGKGR
jgi:ferredoxin